MEIDQDNLQTGTARQSFVSWALLKLLVCYNFRQRRWFSLNYSKLYVRNCAN